MRSVTGRVLFARDVDGRPKPLRNFGLQLWDLDVISNDFLAKGYTDNDGRFTLTYDPRDAGEHWGDKPDLVLRVLDREYSYDKNGRPQSRWSVVGSFHAPPNITDEVFDFGDLRIAYWEYEDVETPHAVAFTPRVAVVDGRVPQPQRAGRIQAQVIVGMLNKLAHAKLTLISRFSKEHPTNEQIEERYQSTRPIPRRREVTSDLFLSDMVLNGFNPCIPRARGDGTYLVPFRWNGVQQDGLHFAPNTSARFRIVDNRFEILGIAVRKRVDGDCSAHALYRAPKVYYPTDEEWGRVKRLFRVNYFALGEVTTHLTETHLNVEQYILALRRNISRNPIGRLLFPHLYGTTAVNLAANDILISERGLVQKCSALTSGSVQHLARAAFGGLNWYGWTPRRPLCAEHWFARIGQLYWEVLTEYVDAYFEEHAAEIRRYWPEVHAMSQELVAHALPWCVDPDIDRCYDTGELNTSDKPHPEVDGVVVALSPVTEHDTPDAAGLANLQQFCRYVLFTATFKHSWVNDLQFQMGREIEFATLGVNDDLTNLRVPSDKVVPPSEALEHPFITHVLSFTQYGYIFRNEDDDMNPDLIRAIMRRFHDFERLGYDVRKMRSCINT